MFPMVEPKFPPPVSPERSSILRCRSRRSISSMPPLPPPMRPDIPPIAEELPPRPDKDLRELSEPMLKPESPPEDPRPDSSRPEAIRRLRN